MLPIWWITEISENYHMRSIFMSNKEIQVRNSKLKVLKEHEEGASFYSLESTVKRWNAAFIAHGESARAS